MHNNLNSSDFERGIQENENAVLMDVRTPQEWSEGIIPKAIKINVMSPDFMNEIKKLDASKHYYIYCRSGARSANACGIMEQMGFRHLNNLAGGIIEWKGDVRVE